MRRTLLALLLATGVCAAPTRPDGCDGTQYRIIQRRADSTFATDTYVPSVYRAAAGETNIWVATPAGATLAKDTVGADQLWFRDPAITSATGGDSIVIWSGGTVARPDTTGVWKQTHGGSVDYEFVWSFDEASGTTAQDAAGNYAGSIAGATHGAAGVVGNCLDFEATGSTDVVYNADACNWDTTNAWTVMVWVRPEAPIAVSGVASRAYYVSSSSHRGLNFFTQLSDSILSFGIWGSNSTNRVSGGTAAPVFGSGTWTFLANVHAPGARASAISIYANESFVDVNISTDGLTSFTKQAVPFAIGARSNSTGTGFDIWYDGLIDQPKAARAALSEGQIRNARSNELGFASNASFTVGELQQYRSRRLFKVFGFQFYWPW